MRSRTFGLTDVTRRAWIALKKMKVGPPEDTVESLTYKITRLLEINAVLQGIVNVVTPREISPTH